MHTSGQQASGGPQRAMTKIDFYTLPRSIQDRLRQSFRGEFDPKPIASRRTTRPNSLVWLGVSAAATVLGVVLWSWGLGELGSALARHPMAAIAVYVLLAVALVLGLVQALSYRIAIRGLPFPPGIYLFPASLIDAREASLRVISLDQLTHVDAQGRQALRARFGADSFRFAVKAAELEQTVQAVRDGSERMATDIDENERQMLDPLVPPLVASPLASDVPIESQSAPWARYRFIIAVIVGLVGVPLFFLRDNLSDSRMFAAATAADDVASYQLYLTRGTAHRAEVSRVLLPRAALRAAVAEGTVEAIQGFSAEYEETDIQPEVSAALTAALTTSFEKASKQGSLAALMQFAERYPEHGLDERLKKAKHAVYARALQRVTAKLAKKDGEVASFLGRLLQAVERTGPGKTAAGVRGPVVEIRMRRMKSRGMKGADELVRSNPQFGGAVTYPSRYVAADHIGPLAEDAAKSLAAALSREFDPAVVSFAPGAAIDGSEPLGAMKVPTLVLSYRVESTGNGYASKTPRCVFVGLAFFFKTRFVLPGDEEPLHVNYVSAQGIPTRLIVNWEGKTRGGVLETKIYGTMIQKAFADGQERYFAAWFEEPKSE